jgi:hypothetical protein
MTDTVPTVRPQTEVITPVGLPATQINELDVLNLNANNITAGTINGSLVKVTKISASNITSGTLDASVVTVTNLNASNINTGTLNASIVTVTNLNANNITAGTLTGRTVQTSSSGQRIVLDGSANTISIYDSTPALRIQSSTGGLNLLLADGVTSAGIFSAVTYSPGVSAISVSQNFNIVSNLFVGGTISSTASPNMSSGLIPDQDNVYNNGDNTHRWKLVRGVTITSGDLAWEETTCYLCGQSFEQGDKLTMIVKAVKTTKGESLTHTVPICKACFLAA